MQSPALSLLAMRPDAGRSTCAASPRYPPIRGSGSSSARRGVYGLRPVDRRAPCLPRAVRPRAPHCSQSMRKWPSHACRPDSMRIGRLANSRLTDAPARLLASPANAASAVSAAYRRGTADRGRRATRCGAGESGERRGLREDSHPIRRSDRIIPGGQASLRRGATRGGTRRCGVGGRGPAGIVRRCRVGVHRGHPRRSSPPPSRASRSTGASGSRGSIRRTGTFAVLGSTLISSGPPTAHREAIARSAGLTAARKRGVDDG